MIDHDFHSGALLSHMIEGSGTFTGVAELGRASAQVGSGNGGLIARAAQLGAHMNGVRWTVRAPTAIGRVEIDANRTSGLPHIRFTPPTGPDSSECADGYHIYERAAYVTRDAAAVRRITEITLGPVGDGTDPPVAGTALLANGEEPRRMYGGSVYEAEDTDAGLLCYDAPFPLVLTEFHANLGSSVAWELRLAQLLGSRTVASYSIIASGTGSRPRTNVQAVIPPGYGLSFVAATTGAATAVVRKHLP